VAPSSDLSKALLTASDMEQVVPDGTWNPTVLTPNGATSPCFEPPANPPESAGVQLSEDLGPVVGEVVESFPTVEQASQAYESFVTSEDGCSWMPSGASMRFTAVRDSNARNLGTASAAVWEVQGTFSGILSGGGPMHEGAFIAVRSGNVDAFALIAGGKGFVGPPDMPTIEQKIAPALASKLESSH